MDHLARRVLAAFFGLWMTLSVGLLAVACGPLPGHDEQVAADQVEVGTSHLARSRPDLARQAFAAAIVADPLSPEAAFGLGLSELAMLPGSPASRALLAELGLEAPEPASDLFGPTGLLSDLHRRVVREAVRARLLAMLGAPEDGWDGVRDLLGSLPPTTTPATLAARAGELAAELNVIATRFEVAGDRRVRPLDLVVPGGLFHLDADLAVGPAEARALGGATRAVRTLLLVVSAYRFSDRPLCDLAGYEGEELAAALSGLVADAAPPASLATGRRDLTAALDDLAAALEAGAEVGLRPGQVVAWGLVPPEELAGVRALVDAVRAALEAPTVLPDTEPSTVLDLSGLFARPPKLPVEAAFFEPDDAGEPELSLGFVEALAESAGLASPPLRLEPETQPTLFSGGVPEPGWLSRWLAPTLERLETDLGL